MIDTSCWKSFPLTGKGGIFEIESCKCSNAGELLVDGNDIEYIGAKKNDNGFMRFVKYDASLVSKGNCIIFICDGQGSVGYANYINHEFIGSTTLSVGYNDRLNDKNGLFIVTILDLERYRYSFGRKYKTNLAKVSIKLPTTSDGNPDWDYMEEYINKLDFNPIKTKNTITNSIKLDYSNWQEFNISDIFEVKYGINLELVNCEEATVDDIEAINFVSRSKENNGVTAYIKKIPEIEPQDAGLITVAGGGSSVLSTFVQNKPFYSGRDLYLLIPRNEMSIYAKHFICTIIMANKYKYNFGRQANKTLGQIKIMLPAISDTELDYNYMDNYIKSLPYGDRI